MKQEKTLGHGYFPICFLCKYYEFEGVGDRLNNRCKAFPTIPDEIWEGKFDHRYPHPDDTGIQFEKIESVDKLSMLIRPRTMEFVEKMLQQSINDLEENRRKGIALPPFNEE